MSDKLYPLSFKSNIKYIRNKRIFEYDIVSAGYSLTISEKLITDEELLTKLFEANKKERQILLGLYAKNNKTFVKELNDAFRKYITAFIYLNNIKDSNILYIKKDSITFFDNLDVTRTKFKQAIFTKREEFTSHLRIDKLEFYYDSSTNKSLVKGIGLKDYTGTLLEEIFRIMKIAEFSPKSVVENNLKTLRLAYVNRELEDSYYRELSSMNAFQLNNNIAQNRVYSTHALQSDDAFFEDVNINYNYIHILMPLFEIFV